MKISATRIYLIALCLFISKLSFAQETDSVKHKWYIPSSITIQHAGSIGFFSLGAGYYLNKSHSSTLDISYGYVPAKFGGDLNIIAAKFCWRPFAVKLSDWALILPVNPGAFLSYHAGGDYDSSWDDDDYPKGYYWWSTAFRPHITVSTEIKLDAQKILKTSRIKSISLYSEFNTNELYFVSYFQNMRRLDVNDIFKLGFGTRIYF
ncbi:hypothetical protein [Pedobacter puniceum]|jgi:hypothetical protein|uniref:DUF3575 domain-containing protein n=1 Tax=Pedobacter puniceum TaxID=2666136 RepID=A0A7K0FRI1_9SPHI|nr:hypothetical protein [Pedobacter puniceum]MRX48352.1 hypothetical protein [Pedobacter puniceum]